MTGILNVKFSLKLQYYSGFVVYKREMLKDIVMNVNNSAYQAQILVQLLNHYSPVRPGDHYDRATQKFSVTFMEIPYISDATRAESNVFKPKNILRVGKTLMKLIIRGY
jgi:hypothetical protein